MSNHCKELRIIVLIIFSAFVLVNLVISGYYILSGGISSSGMENLLEDRVLMLSLNKSLQLSLGRPDTSIAGFGTGFSNMILKSTNINHQLPQINGEIIKAVIQSFEENELDPTFTMELEITNLLIEPLNREDFIVPQQYTITNK